MPGPEAAEPFHATAEELLGPPIDKQLLSEMPIEALIRRYSLGVEQFDERVFEMPGDQLDQAFLPDVGLGRWPIRVVLGHVTDNEVSSVHRMRRIAAEDNPVLGAWDEHAFIDSGLYGSTTADNWPTPRHPVGAFVAVMYTLRQWTAAWLSGLDEQTLARTAMHPERGPFTIRGILEYDTWHLEHHARYVNAKTIRFLGPAPEPEPCDDMPAGGCGSGCGCASRG